MERNYLIRNASWLAGMVWAGYRMKRDVLTVVVGSALTIFLDLIVRVVIHTFLGVLMYCIRYFVSSSITGLCLDSGAGLMACGAAGRDGFEFDRCVLRVNETDDFAASLSVLVFGMLFCRYTLLPKSPPGVRHRNMRQASCSSLSTTSHISQVHSCPCDVLHIQNKHPPDSPGTPRPILDHVLQISRFVSSLSLVLSFSFHTQRTDSV